MKNQIIISTVLAHYMYIVGASTLIPDYLNGKITAHWLVEYIVFGYIFGLLPLMGIFIYLIKKNKL